MKINMYTKSLTTSIAIFSFWIVLTIRKTYAWFSKIFIIRPYRDRFLLGNTPHSLPVGVFVNYAEELKAIEHQIDMLLTEKGLTRADMYTHDNFTYGEKYVLMNLLEARSKLAKEELLFMHQRFTNVIFLHNYVKRGDKK